MFWGNSRVTEATKEWRAWGGVMGEQGLPCLVGTLNNSADPAFSRGLYYISSDQIFVNLAITIAFSLSPQNNFVKSTSIRKWRLFLLLTWLNCLHDFIWLQKVTEAKNNVHFWAKASRGLACFCAVSLRSLETPWQQACANLMDSETTESKTHHPIWGSLRPSNLLVT